MIIAISGRIGSGKDTVGKIIQYLIATSRHNHNMTLNEYEDIFMDSDKWSEWKIKKFAGKLKEIASLLTGVPKHKFEDQDFKNSEMPSEWEYYKQMYETDENNQDGSAWMPMTYREFLQRLGTEAIRNGLHENAWVNALFSDYVPTRKKVQVDDVDERVDEMPKWVITDLRFPNEFKAVKQRGGICVYCRRIDPNDTRRFNEVPYWNHPSETALDAYTFDYVINNSGTIDDLVEEVRKMLVHFILLTD